MKITHPDMLHPELMQIEVANRVKDITAALTEVYDIQQLGQHVATTIGAGQVIVKGVFTVKDWVTEGETTIDGGHIEAGSLTVSSAEIASLVAGKITGQLINAQIADLAFAKITNVLITNALIVDMAVGKLTGGTIGAHTIILSGAASILMSSDFVGETTGWQIRGDGAAVFNEVAVRGAIYAGAGSVILLSTRTLT
ncbi:hypothetical protein ES708_25589 [subsurface metagenome]